MTQRAIELVFAFACFALAALIVALFSYALGWEFVLVSAAVVGVVFLLVEVYERLTILQQFDGWLAIFDRPVVVLWSVMMVVGVSGAIWEMVHG